MKGLIPKAIKNLKISHRENGQQRKPLEDDRWLSSKFQKSVMIETGVLSLTMYLVISK